MTEPIRLLVWDLDETFWQGTLTEGGITYRQDTHDIVVALARRGIPSAICSKNDIGPVRDILTARGIWDYFIFPSIDWTPKGPRLRALAEAVQLRPETIAFIDDNALNRAEAEHFVPGLRAYDETVIPTLLDEPLLRGKPDPELTRLRQYRLLQERQTALTQTGDTDAFLRDSAIRVTIDYDVGASLDRAIELVNRTNQLNFTKRRLPEDVHAARAELREQLKGMFMKAGLVRVQDRYGDYGVCGLYMMQHRHGYPARLLQYCFSCRILNMGIETWLYRLLGRPALDVAGTVLTDVVGDTREITWINAAQAGDADTDAAARLDHVLLRGGCDIHIIAHYFGNDTGRVIRELHEVRDGLEPSVSHSIMLKHAIEGASSALREAAAPFGFRDTDFSSVAALPPPPNAGPAVWVLSFVHDNQTMLYRFKPTGGIAARPLLQVTASRAQLYRPETGGRWRACGRAEAPGDVFRVRRSSRRRHVHRQPDTAVPPRAGTCACVRAARQRAGREQAERGRPEPRNDQAEPADRRSGRGLCKRRDGISGSVPGSGHAGAAGQSLRTGGILPHLPAHTRADLIPLKQARKQSFFEKKD